MNKSKSKAAYTNKWLNRNKRFWHEETRWGATGIVIDKKDAPKIVIERVKEINTKRGYYGSCIAKDDPINKLVNCLRQIPNKKKPRKKRIIKMLEGPADIEINYAKLSDIFKEED